MQTALEKMQKTLTDLKSRRANVTEILGESPMYDSSVAQSELKSIDVDIADLRTEIENILSKKREEERLREAAERREREAKQMVAAMHMQLIVILQKTHTAVVGINEEGVALFWNDASQRVFGWSSSEVIGKNIADFLIPERYADFHRQGIQRASANKKFDAELFYELIETHALTKARGEIPILLTILVVPQPDTTVQYLAALFDPREDYPVIKMDDLIARKKARAE